MSSPSPLEVVVELNWDVPADNVVVVVSRLQNGSKLMWNCFSSGHCIKSLSNERMDVEIG